MVLKDFWKRKLLQVLPKAKQFSCVVFVGCLDVKSTWKEGVVLFGQWMFSRSRPPSSLHRLLLLPHLSVVDSERCSLLGGAKSSTFVLQDFLRKKDRKTIPVDDGFWGKAFKLIFKPASSVRPGQSQEFVGFQRPFERSLWSNNRSNRSCFPTGSKQGKKKKKLCSI